MHTCLINGHSCVFIYQKKLHPVHPYQTCPFSKFFHFLCSDNYIFALSIYCPKQKFPPYLFIDLCKKYNPAHTCAASQVNGASCSLILPPLISPILFRCFILDCYSISICKQEKLKDETSKKNCETNGSRQYLHRFHKFSLDVSSLIVTTTAFVEKDRSKMRHLKKICETSGKLGLLQW